MFLCIHPDSTGYILHAFTGGLRKPQGMSCTRRVYVAIRSKVQPRGLAVQ